MKWALAVLLLLGLPAQAHDIYTDWKQPGTNKSCCSGGPHTGDCYPTQAKWKDGHWTALRREDGQFIPIPDKALLLPIDENAHLCAPPAGDPYCFRPPVMGT